MTYFPALFAQSASLAKAVQALSCMLCASLILTGCSYFDTGAAPSGERVNISTGQTAVNAPASTISEVSSAPMRQGGGSVEIFSLDQPSALTDSSPPVSSPAAGVQLTPPAGSGLGAAPGVEIFMGPASQGNNMPVLQPPAGAASPFTDFSDGPLSSRQDQGFVTVQTAGMAGGGAVIYFAHDSTSLDAGDRSVLAGIARSGGSGLLAVEGHASVRSSLQDPVARKVVNLKISMDRAFAVSRALIESGVPAERIVTSAFGETRPPAAVAGMEPDAASRRVEVSGAGL